METEVVLQRQLGQASDIVDGAVGEVGRRAYEHDGVGVDLESERDVSIQISSRLEAY